MARNTDLNAYWTVGIPKHSVIYRRLVQDAKDRGVSVPTLIAMRVGDFYKYGVQTALPGAESETSSEVTEPDLHVVPMAADTDEATPPVVEMDQEEANALAALDAWG